MEHTKGTRNRWLMQATLLRLRHINQPRMPPLPSFDILFQKVNQSSYSLSLLYHSLYQAHIHSFNPTLRSQPTAKMKYTFTVAAFLALATAQSIADLPSCSLSCVLTGVTATGCSPTDFACSCGKARSTGQPSGDSGLQRHSSSWMLWLWTMQSTNAQNWSHD